MKIEKRTKSSFSVIGKEGSTLNGQGFIQNLWEDANSHFNEVQSLWYPQISCGQYRTIAKSSRRPESHSLA